MIPRMTWLRGAAALPCLLIVYALLWNSALPAAFTLGLAAFGLAASIRPGACLLIVTALVPFVGAWAGRWSGGVRWPEAIVIVFLAGVLVRFTVRPPRVPIPPDALNRIAVVFAFLIAASAMVELVVLQYASDFPRPFVVRLWRFLTRDYFMGPGIFSRLLEATLFLEGIALLVWTRRLAAADRSLSRRLLHMSVVAAFATAALNLLRLLEIWFRSGGGADALRQLITSIRINTTYADLNAAGSYFALMLPSALALASGGRRAAAWLMAGSAIAASLWLTGSRLAIAAAGIGVVIFLAAALVRAPHRRRLRAAALVAVLVLVTWIVIVYPRDRNISARAALNVRVDLARVAVQLFETRPILGIGIGMFYPRSGEYIPPDLKRFYAFENAHNNFLQILTELGTIGFGLFLAVLAAALGPARRARGRDAMLAVGVLSGVSAFLLTCLGGHPLLTREVAYPFWILLGVASALREPPTADIERASATRRQWWRRARWWTAIGVAALVLSIPLRAAYEIGARNFENGAIGYSIWSTAADDGVRFRWARSRSAFFVPGAAGSAAFPVRVGPGSTRQSYLIDVRLDGRIINTVTIYTDRWTPVRVVIPRGKRSARYRRIELNVRDAPDPAMDPRDAEGFPKGGVMVGRVSES